MNCPNCRDGLFVRIKHEVDNCGNETNEYICRDCECQWLEQTTLTVYVAGKKQYEVK